MNKKFFDFIELLSRKYPGEKFALAVSGGLDSVSLMHWFSVTGLPCVALTVDHGLRPESASEASGVAKLAKKLGIPHETLLWTGDKPVTGLEAAARTARYDLMIKYCKENNIGILLTAHQADDQIETFLMNLARGSGVYGLAGIRSERIRDGIIIARPLLNISRAELKDYCDVNGIAYFNDAMNIDEKFTRVKIRQHRAVLRDILGISDERILLAMENLSRVRDGLEFDVEKIINEIRNKNYETRTVFDAVSLFSYPEEIVFKILSRLIQKTGGMQYPPRLAEIQRAAMRLKTNCKFTLGRCIVRRLENKILIAPEGASVSFRNKK